MLLHALLLFSITGLQDLVYQKTSFPTVADKFTSNLWSELNKLLGIDTNTTTAYQPQANGMVERLHRQLKAALKARTTGPDWFDQLPMVLLGIRSSWRVDPDCSPAELVYETTLRIPGEFLQPCDTSTTTPDITFLRNLQQTMHSIQPPAPKFHGNQTSCVPSTLATAKYVYVRKDSHKHPSNAPMTAHFASSTKVTNTSPWKSKGDQRLYLLLALRQLT